MNRKSFFNIQVKPYLRMLYISLSLVICVAANIVISAQNNKSCPKRCMCGSSSEGSTIDCSGGGLTSPPRFGDAKNVKRLILKDNSISQIDHLDFDSFLSLEELDLRGNLIKTIPNYAFLGLKNLKTLSIQADTWQPSCLHGLTQLKEIRLYGSLKTQAFDNALLRETMNTLQNVSIHGTAVTEIPKHFLSGFKNLQVVNFRGNKIERVDTEAFLDTTVLELDLSCNNITELIAPKLQKVFHLKKLNVSRNNIVSSTSLKEFPELQGLDASHNKIISFPVELLKPMKSLKYLLLSNNKLTKFVVTNCYTLKTIDLNDNGRLRSVTLDDYWNDGYDDEDSDGFSGYSTSGKCELDKLGLRGMNITRFYLDMYIKDFDLSNNCQLKYISFGPNLYQIDRLDMSSSCLRNVNHIIFHGHFDHLDLHNNSFAGTITIHGDAKVLDLSKNFVSSIKINRPYSRYWSFHSLDLSANNISGSQQIFHFPSNYKYFEVKKLYLDNNRFQAPPNLTMNTKVIVRKLSLCNNTLKDLNTSLAIYIPASTVHSLELDNNGISVIGDSIFKGFDSLESLSLDNNKISFLSRLVGSTLRSLRKLSLRKNHFKKLPTEFITRLPRLETLNLRDNMISTLDDRFLYHHESLSNVNFDNNGIQFLPDSFFHRNTTKLDPLRVSLYKNRLQCGCNLTVTLSVGYVEPYGTCVFHDGEKENIPLKYFVKTIEELSAESGGCNLCPLQPCGNFGVCQHNKEFGFQCECRQGWSGRRCEKITSDCYHKTCRICNKTFCENGGTCIELSETNARCQCPIYFSGDRCQHYICQCQNNGTCKVGPYGKVSCVCLPNYVGKYCEQERESFCESKLCNEKGLCIYNEVSKVNSCICERGWSGLDCDVSNRLNFKKGISSSTIGIIILTGILVMLLLATLYITRKYGICARTYKRKRLEEFVEDFDL